MSTTQEVTLKVKSDIKDTTKDAQELAAEISFMGVSLKDVKGGFASMTSVARKSFRTIKAGLISTGIGAFVVAIASLSTYFTQTKRGAEILETAMAGLSATFRVLIDRVSQFGGGIAKILDGKFTEGLKDMGKSFLGIGNEIKTDTLAALALSKAFQKLRDDERDLSVETAKRRADIEELKLIAEDTTKSEQVRLKAAQDAFNIENDLLAKRIANAEKAVQIEKDRNKDRIKTQEDLDKEAQLEINLANIRGESLTKQIELNNKINAIKKEAQTKRDEELQALKDEGDLLTGNLIEIPRISNEVTEELAQANQEADVDDQRRKKNEIEREKMVLAAKKTMAMQGLEILSQAAGKGTALAKGVAITQATISGVEAVQNAFKTASNSPLNVLIPGYNFIQAGIAGTFAALNIRKIASGQGPGGEGSSGAGAGSGGTPTPSLLSGSFDLGGIQAPEPVQAFVVTDDMTNSQNKLATIRRRSTI
tara:strand:+ start:273 stop:1712 length:1440 start_codon:yes stop_codon:yes gene_type:complete